MPPNADDDAATASPGAEYEGEESGSKESESDEPAAEAPAESAPRKRRRLRRFVLISLAVLAVLAAGGAVTGWLYVRSVEKSVERFDAFEDIPEEVRPPKVEQNATNMLILGSDSRDPENTTGSRSDTIILAHVTKDRSSAQLVSIPRDTWVYVPPSKDGQHGDTEAKINAAYAWGGIPLTVQTVERFTGVRIDHVVVVDFAGFKEIVDALGGIEIDVDQNFTTTHSQYTSGGRRFRMGRQHMDGATALDYARERKALKDGDFGRIRHQQQVIKAIMDRAANAGLLTNPSRLNAFLRATADAIAADETFDILGTATDLRDLRSEQVTFYTSPSRGTGKVGDQSVVFADTAKAAALYDAIRRDAVAEIAQIAGR